MQKPEKLEREFPKKEDKVFIGRKEIDKVEESNEATPDGVALVEVLFKDGQRELFSKQMYDVSVSRESCDENILRDKRIFPIVAAILLILRNWGIKLSELPYMSAVLNRSLEENQKQALNELWSQWMPKPLSPDEVTLITVDRVLRSVKKTLKDVFNEK